MQDIRILLVEDDLSLALEIEMMINELGYIFQGNSTNGDEALQLITEARPDLIIMDINIEGAKNGLEVAREIASEKIPLIFITAFQNEEYFQEAKKIAPAAYLIKPFQLLTLQNTIELAVMKAVTGKSTDPARWENSISGEGSTIFIKMNKRLQKISVGEIHWIEVSGNYCYIYTKTKKYILKISLTSILKKIVAHAEFIRVHKQHVVQRKYIDSVDTNTNTLNIGNSVIPIGRRFKKDLLLRINLL